MLLIFSSHNQRVIALHKQIAITLILPALIIYACPAFSQTIIPISQFSKRNLSDWESKSFQGNTLYKLVEDEHQTVLKAVSQNTASGLAKRIRIDLKETPYLNWSWKIEKTLPAMDETKKQGDDYAARLYVIIEGGWAFWNTKALNYVFSSNQTKGSHWDNAYAGEHAKMMAVNGPTDTANTWIHNKRNVYQDLQNNFSDANKNALRYIDAIAIMTDTDNSHATATAWYGDIFFSSE